MTLYLVGLGLGDAQDITLRGLEIAKKADVVYLERYTSVLGASKEALEGLYGRGILVADRELVERRAEELLVAPAKTKDVVLLVVGDPFGATTHTDLALRAHEAGVELRVVHNASVMNAIGEVGLELYKFGKTTSVPYWEPKFEPQTPYDVIKENRARGAHTLCLLDIKADRERYMTIAEAIAILQRIEALRGERVILPTTVGVGVARLGHADRRIVAGPLAAIAQADFGAPLHSLIIPGTLQVVEEEALARWRS